MEIALVLFAHLLLFLSFTSATTSPAQKPSPSLLPNNNTIFIKKSCEKIQTSYIDDDSVEPLCFSVLSPYANDIGSSPLKLAKTSVAIAIQNVTVVSNSIMELPKNQSLSKAETGVWHDCVTMMASAVSHLNHTIKKMKKLKEMPVPPMAKSDLVMEMSNVLTSEETCNDSVQDMKSRIGDKFIATIEGYVGAVRNISRIPLAIINMIL